MHHNEVKKYVFVVIIVGIAIVLEVYLRMVWGFCNAPLYRVSNKYEYIVLPSQDGMRFGSHYHYNSYSQRSEEPDTTRRKVLGLGDSVLNGGVISDQDSIATSIFSKNTSIQMLNISAGSWGPDNCAAYLEENGLFDASLIYLLVSSHDAHDVMTHEPIVGVHKNYPDKQYPLAIAELIDRYLIPKFLHTHTPAAGELDPDQKVLNGIDKRMNGGAMIFNPGFSRLKMMADSAGIPMIVTLHATLPELKAGAYDSQGEEIIEWCAVNNIPIIRDLDEGITSKMYRDGIHINDAGQKLHAVIMEKYILKVLQGAIDR